MVPPEAPTLLERFADSPFTTGAIGAFIAAFRWLPGLSWQEKVFNAACGTAIAGYLSPALLEYLHRTEAVYRSGGAFLIGLLGMSIVSALVQGIKDTPLGTIITGWISRRGDTK